MKVQTIQKISCNFHEKIQNFAKCKYTGGQNPQQWNLIICENGHEIFRKYYSSTCCLLRTELFDKFAFDNPYQIILWVTNDNSYIYVLQCQGPASGCLVPYPDLTVRRLSLYKILLFLLSQYYTQYTRMLAVSIVFTKFIL